MELQTVVRRRRMVRSFEDRPVPPEVVDRILENALHAPSAGFSQGWAFVVLEGREQTSVFWETTTDPSWRDRPNWPELMNAPVVILPLSHKRAYVERYSEPDKEGTEMDDEAKWPVPYWDIDTAFASMIMLLTVVDAGLGALFFGIVHGEREMLAALGVPDGYRPIGAIALGYPAAGDRPSPSLARGRRPVEEVVHRGRW